MSALKSNVMLTSDHPLYSRIVTSTWQKWRKSRTQKGDKTETMRRAWATKGRNWPLSTQTKVAALPLPQRPSLSHFLGFLPQNTQSSFEMWVASWCDSSLCSVFIKCALWLHSMAKRPTWHYLLFVKKRRWNKGLRGGTNQFRSQFVNLLMGRASFFLWNWMILTCNCGYNQTLWKRHGSSFFSHGTAFWNFLCRSTTTTSSSANGTSSLPPPHF